VVHEPPNWEELVAAHTTDRSVVDELETFRSSWYAVDLFELRTYAELFRSGAVILENMISVDGGKVYATWLEPRYRKGRSTSIPTGWAGPFYGIQQDLYPTTIAVEHGKQPI
jgi:hypothetical protein